MRISDWSSDVCSSDLADGWYHTGDAGSIDADGYLWIRGRVKDMIISGGENIYPAEVENILFGHEDVAEVAVIGVPDDSWGEAVTAFVVPKPGRAIDAPALIEWSRSEEPTSEIKYLMRLTYD